MLSFYHKKLAHRIDISYVSWISTQDYLNRIQVFKYRQLFKNFSRFDSIIAKIYIKSLKLGKFCYGGKRTNINYLIITQLYGQLL